jgi:hypothetical protein
MASSKSLVLRIPILVLGIFLSWIALSSHAAVRPGATGSSASEPKVADGLAAWEQVYSVLTHPRCINCHTATNYPQQGDARNRHFANVIRGPEGKGVPGLNCASCTRNRMRRAPACPGDTIGIWRHSRCDGRTRMINHCRAPQCAGR